jgi:hypothetical protein
MDVLMISFNFFVGKIVFRRVAINIYCLRNASIEAMESFELLQCGWDVVEANAGMLWLVNGSCFDKVLGGGLDRLLSDFD